MKTKPSKPLFSFFEQAWKATVCTVCCETSVILYVKLAKRKLETCGYVETSGLSAKNLLPVCLALDKYTAFVTGTFLEYGG